MSKKILAAAIAAAVAAPIAATADSANVTVYGKAHVMVVNSDTELGGTTIDDDWSVGSTNSRLGFKGSEDLGNGLKAIWKYETTVNITDGGSAGGTFGSARNAYLGLSGAFGSVLVGRHDTPAKVAWYAAGNDHLDGSIIDFNDIGFSGGGIDGATYTKAFIHDRRIDNVIAYISPSFSGFTVAGSITPGEDDTGPRDGLADTYSLGGMWSGGGFKASAGYESVDFDTGGGLEEEDSWFIGGSATFGMFTVGAAYQDVSDVSGVDGVDQMTWGLSGKVSFGNNDIIANYADGEIEVSGSSDVDYEDYGIAFQHRFSKRTSAYVAYNASELDNDDQDQYGVGMIHNF